MFPRELKSKTKTLIRFSTDLMAGIERALINPLCSPHINPVCLPDRFENFNGRRCFVTGWGKDAFVGGNYQQVGTLIELWSHGYSY